MTAPETGSASCGACFLSLRHTCRGKKAEKASGVFPPGPLISAFRLRPRRHDGTGYRLRFVRGLFFGEKASGPPLPPRRQRRRGGKQEMEKYSPMQALFFLPAPEGPREGVRDTS